MKRALFVLAWTYAVLIISGCGGGSVPLSTLSVGTLHTIYAAPLGMAASEKMPIFQENGLKVNIVYYEDSSQIEQALAAEEIDGALTDFASALLLNRESEQVKVVMTVLRPFSGETPPWALMQAPGIVSRDVAGQRVAIPEGITPQYTAHGILDDLGIDPKSVDWLVVEDGWAALAALENGEATAALVPEPALSAAMERGATTLADNRWSPLSQLVVLFREPVVDASMVDLYYGKTTVIKQFIKSYEQAIWELNSKADSGKYWDLMMEMGKLSPDDGDVLSVPLFPWPADIPIESEVDNLNQWLLAQGILSQPVDYKMVVEPALRPSPAEFAVAECCKE